MVSSLLSPNFKGQPPTLNDVKFASIIWGLTLGLGLLTAWRIVEQMIPIWHRRRCLKSLYIWMVWILWFNNMVQSVVAWTFMDGIIHPGLLVFFWMIITWALQTQLILQIIINRASLIMVDKRKATLLSWGIATVVLIINISVFCIWIPARLQISEQIMTINKIWDRIEKIIFLLLDAGLNAYFLYLVKSRLISQGLDKYKPLFNFNSVIIIVSLAMDVLLIAMMDLKNSFSYIAFHPLAYMIKLYIELVLTELLIRVVRSSQTPNYLSAGRAQTTHGSQHQRKRSSSPLSELTPNGSLSKITERACRPQNIAKSRSSQLNATLKNSIELELNEISNHSQDPILVNESLETKVTSSKEEVNIYKS